MRLSFKTLKKRIKMITSIIVFTVLTSMILLSISPANTVRMTMFLSGHPSYAIKCNPVHDTGLSKAMDANIYTIQDKYAYNRLGMKHVVLFEVHTILIFHTATATYRYF